MLGSTTSVFFGTCVPIIGSGASIGAGGPSWTRYLQLLGTGLGADLVARLTHSSEPTEVATALLQERRVRGLRPLAIQIAGPTAVHAALASWRCPLYATTNYDDGLERAFQGDCDVLYNDQLSSLVLQQVPTPRRSRPTQVKLACSSSDERGTGAATREEFAELLHRDLGALELLVTLLRCRTLVFVGCGMRDPLLRAALDRSLVSGVGTQRHVAFLPADADAALIKALELVHVDTVTYSIADRSKHLAERLYECGGKRPARTSSSCSSRARRRKLAPSSRRAFASRRGTVPR